MKSEFLIKWKGFSFGKSSNLIKCGKLIKIKFHSKFQMKRIQNLSEIKILFDSTIGNKSHSQLFIKFHFELKVFLALPSNYFSFSRGKFVTIAFTQFKEEHTKTLRKHSNYLRPTRVIFTFFRVEESFKWNFHTFLPNSLQKRQWKNLQMIGWQMRLNSKTNWRQINCTTTQPACTKWRDKKTCHSI